MAWHSSLIAMAWFASALLAMIAIAEAADPRAALSHEILGSVRVNNRTPIVVFRIEPRRSRLAEIRLRSGGLPLLLDAVEIVYADGGRQRVQGFERLPPGRQSKAIETDRRRPIREVSATLQPGLHPGETNIQLIGRLADRPH